MLKNIYLFCLFAILTPQYCLASPLGFYLGGQIGWADVHQGEVLADNFTLLAQKIYPAVDADDINFLFNNTGLAGHIYLGYQFIPYFAMELGYYRFTRLDIHADVGININVLRYLDLSFPLDLVADGSVTTYVIDLAAKGIWPISEKFSLYGKLGLAYLNSDTKLTLAAKTSIVDVSISANPSVNLVYPLIGVGVSYQLLKKLAIDFSWTHIQKYSQSAYPNIDFVGVGFLYYLT